jgi:hypothetical protein
MGKAVTLVAILVVAVLLTTLLVAIHYYNDLLNEKNSKQLITSLGVVEIKGKDSNLLGIPSPIPYDYLYITGIVNNTAKNTIYNAGLYVIAYDSNSSLNFNMTIPLALRGIFGGDNATSEFVSKNYGTNFASREVLGSNETAYVTMSILHEGTVTSWNITPVWTNSP